jgi:peptide/nickel transport system ATP-binding protein
MSPPLIELDDVVKTFPVNHSWVSHLLGNERHVNAVNGVSLSIAAGETLALVGESGSGKSTLANIITGLHAPTSGSVQYRGETLGPATSRSNEVHSDISMVFQNPKASLNPRMTTVKIIAEPMSARGWTRERRKTRVHDLLKQVNLSKAHLTRYPHELSGGEAQRVAIARAIATHPKVLILDEPVSALDVSVQAKILNLLMDIQQKLDITCLFIAHDLNIVQQIADRTAVMYLGKLMEVAPTETLFARPAHPYTEALLSAIPAVDPSAEKERISLGEDVPDPMNPPSGCAFSTRCPYAEPECRSVEPESVEIQDARSWCHFAESFVDERKPAVTAEE